MVDSDADNQSLNPWELSGTLCGLLCTGINRREAIATVAEVVGQVEKSNPTAALLTALQTHLADLEQRLTATDDLFEPDLPEDDETLAVRVAALAAWSRGFQMGLVQSPDGPDLSRLSAESREAVEDISHFCHLDDAGEHHEDPIEEDAYLHLVEYLRVAVALIHADLTAPAAPPPTDAPPASRLH